MLLTSSLVELRTTTYLDAIDYLNRMKNENKFNESTLAVFVKLYSEDVDNLVKQGYFNSDNN